MAEALDVVNLIVGDVWAVVEPLVGTTFPLPSQYDVERYGATITVQPTIVQPSKPIQQELEDRLAAGKITIAVESDVHDSVAEQYTNEGRRQDLLERTPLTIAVSAGPFGVWTFSGSASVGNLVGVQDGAIGASYVIAASDTLPGIAAGLAAACETAGITASAAGAAVTLPIDAVVNLGTTATYLKAISRTARGFNVLLYCTEPFTRQFLVRNLESLYKPGMKRMMPEGSELVVLAKLGTHGEDVYGQGDVKDGVFFAQIRWSMQFTVTQVVTKTQIVATTFTTGDALALDASGPIPASML